MKTPYPQTLPHKAGKKRRLLRGAIALIVVAATAGAVIWGFLESREEQSREAEREKPVRAAARVTAGSGVIRVERTAQERSGIATKRLPAARYAGLQ
jgi:hypothetical protein